MSGRLLHQQAAELVQLHLVIAKQIFALGSDEERRIRKDQIKALPRDRCKPVTHPELDVFYSVKAGVKGYERRYPGVHIGGDHRVAVPGRSQAKDAAAGTKIQGGTRVSPDRESGQELA